MTSSRITTDAAELSNLVSGPVLIRGDPHFSDEVTGQNLWLEHNPDIVVGVESENDIVEAVRFALAHNLTIHVQATGHGTRDSINSGMLISTRRFTAVSIDPTSRTATIGAGARWRAVANDAAPHGLAPITGSAPGVGVVGFLLGGGLGPLARSHGFGSDWVRSLRIVTGTGELVTASDTENPELFWALRGGKSGFGIVTEVTVELAEIPALYAGSMTFASAHIDDVLRSWSRWTREVPDTVTSSAAIMRFPDVEQIPVPMRGQAALSIRVAIPASESEAEAIVAPLRQAGPAISDEIGPLPLAEMGRIHNDPEDPSPMYAWTTGYSLTSLNEGFLENLIEAFGARAETPLTNVELRHVGSQRAAPESAAGGRDGDFLFGALGISPVPLDDVFSAAVSSFIAENATSLAAQTPVNFVGELPHADVTARAWTHEDAARLSAIREWADPAGRFAGLR